MFIILTDVGKTVPTVGTNTFAVIGIGVVVVVIVPKIRKQSS
jgi:hypothetical protein